MKKTEEIIKELFKSLPKYQEVLENKMKGSDFIFDYVERLVIYVINLNRCGSYV